MTDNTFSSTLEIQNKKGLHARAAAAFVNVTMTISSILQGCSESIINSRIRATKTAVFPDPAAADTKTFRFLISITFC